MGYAKFEYEENFDLAIGLCITSRAITECEYHSGSYINTEEYDDPEELTSSIIEENPTALSFFKNRNDMVDFVRDALDSAGFECEYCARIRES